MGLKNLIMRSAAKVLYDLDALQWMNRLANSYEVQLNEAKHTFPYIRKRQVRNLQVLIYHRVNDDRDECFPGVPVEFFAEQMEYLASKWNVLPLEEAIERIHKQDLPENAIAITFDDGYRDNFTQAFPILKKLSLPVTIFLATGVIGTGRTLWHDQVFSAFRETRVPFLVGLPSRDDRFDLRIVAEKLDAQAAFLRVIWGLNEEERARAIERLVAALEVPDNKRKQNLMLTWDETRAMQKEGVTFGAHTVAHPILSKLSSQRALEELRDSKVTIERELETQVTLFAYPVGRKGDYNEETKHLVRECGYRAAVSTVPGTNTSEIDVFELRRATPWDQDIASFAMRLNYQKLAS